MYFLCDLSELGVLLFLFGEDLELLRESLVVEDFLEEGEGSFRFDFKRCVFEFFDQREVRVRDVYDETFVVSEV